MATACLGGTAAVAVGCFAGWRPLTKPALERLCAKLFLLFGPKALGGAKCQLRRLTLGGGAGLRVTLNDFVIQNLPEWKSESMLKLTEISASVNLKKMLKTRLKEVEISSLKIEGCELTWEKSIAGLTSSNVDAFLSAIKQTQAEKKKKVEEAPKKRPPKEKKVMLRKLDISGVSVKVVASEASKAHANLMGAPIHFDDFSKVSGVLSLETFQQEMVLQIVMSGKRAVAGVGEVVLETAQSTGAWLYSTIFG